MQRPYSFILFLLIILGILGYLMPWIVTPSRSLSMNAYDLAEWASLHPVVRQTTPFLWTTLLLRFPLAVLGLLLANHIGLSLSRLLSLAIILIAALALLPPLEFFTTYRDDPNYQQQFVLAVLTLALGIITWRNKRLHYGLPILLSIMGCLSASAGLYQAYGLVRGFDLPTSVGFGGLLTATCLAALCILIIKQSSLATLFATKMHTSTAT